MALKLQSIVSHGHIDNRKAGLVTGRLWLYGRKDPLDLEFEGNCLRDMAGSVTTFRNKVSAIKTPSWIDNLQKEQRGTLGDMTASHRAPSPTSAKGTWENMLSLEWFSPEIGRVSLESSSYEIEISDHVFQIDSCDEQAQLMINQIAMRDYVKGILTQATLRPTPSKLAPAPFLAVTRHSKYIDIVADLYREVCEKYGMGQDGEVNRAFAMGWDHVLGAMAYTEETGDPFFFVEPDIDDMPDDMHELTEEEEARICRGNSLYEQIQRFAVQSHEWVKYYDEGIVNTKSPQHLFLKGIYSIVEKLALLFVRMDRGEPDTEGLLTLLEKAMSNAESVFKILSSMSLPGQDRLHNELLAEWCTISKAMLKLKFKLQHRN